MIMSIFFGFTRSEIVEAVNTKFYGDSSISYFDYYTQSPNLFKGEDNIPGKLIFANDMSDKEVARLATEFIIKNRRHYRHIKIIQGPLMIYTWLQIAFGQFKLDEEILNNSGYYSQSYFVEITEDKY